MKKFNYVTNQWKNGESKEHYVWKCYSKKVHEHYPGEHIRVNLDLD